MTQNQSKTRPLPIWQRIPLYLQILIALFLGVGLGVLLGAGQPSPRAAEISKSLAIPCSLVLKALRTLATPLILLAVVNAFLTSSGAAGFSVASLLLSAPGAIWLLGEAATLLEWSLRSSYLLPSRPLPPRLQCPSLCGLC